jgi:multiple sugar transport system substrate-binding protein
VKVRPVVRGIALAVILLVAAAGAYVEAAPSSQSYAGTRLRVAVEFDSEFPMWETEAPAIREQYGIDLDLEVVPSAELYNRLREEAQAGTSSLDIVGFPPIYNGTLMDGLLAPLDEFIARYPIDVADILPPYRDPFMQWNGTTFGVTLDGDILVLYFRRDLFDHPAEQARFKQEYGYELTPPQTWVEYLQIAKFFTRKPGDPLGDSTLKEPFYGTVEWWQPPFNFFWWAARFGSLGGIYFDSDMNPQINSPAGVKALQAYVGALQYMSPDAVNYDYAAVRRDLLEGHAAMAIFWPTEIKLANIPGQYPVAGKLGVASLPGTKLADGTLRVASPIAYAKVLAIPRASRHPEAAFQVIRYMTSPDVSLRWVSDPVTGLDPYRYSHIERLDEWVLRWDGMEQYTDGLVRNLENAYPELTLPGATDYMQVAADQFHRVARGEISAQQAVDNAAGMWNEVTARLGRDRQIAAWRMTVDVWKAAGFR